MANAKTAIKRLKNALDKKYEVSQPAPVAGAVGDGKLFIDGQLYNGAVAGVTQVVNVGRPAAAQYAAKTGGGVIVQSGGGSAVSAGSGSGPDVTALSLLTVVGEAALTSDRYLDVTTALTKTDGGAGGALTIGLATPGGLTVSSTNVATGNHTHAIASSSAPGAAASILASSAAGLLTLPNFTATTGVRTPLIDTASGALTLTPGGASTIINGNVTIQRSGVAGTAGIYSVGDTSGIYPRLALFRARNVLGAEQATVSADILGALSFRGHDGTAYETTGAAEIRGVASETFTPTANGANLRFFTTAVGSTTLSERLRIHNSGNVSILNTTDNGFALDVTGTARASTSLTTPLLTTATNVDLVINPAGTGAVQFPNDQTLRTTSFDSSFPINGWQINEVAGVAGYSALTIGKIQADELAVRVFVADEVRVDRGDEFWTKSYGIVAASFTTPSAIGGTVSVKFEDSPALAGAIFVNNDWVLFRKLEIDTGINLFNVWGQVATYVNNSDGTQNWTFTLRSGPTATEITKGSLAIDFGASGAALIHLSVIDAAGAPYIKMRKWSGANPYTPANFTTYVQLGHLGSTGNAYVTPAGFGLYARSTNDESRFILADDNGLQIRGASFKMYNSTLQTVDISATNGSVKLGTNIASSSTTGFEFNGATGAVTIGNASYPGTVTVYGSITVTGGNAAKTDFSNITATIDNVPNGTSFHRTTPSQVTGAGRAFTALSSGNNLVTSVIPATAIGNPGTAGLYLGSDYMGYHTGSGTAAGWKTYMDSSGNMRLAGNASNNYIQWVAASNKLQGVGGGVEQWYADATDGRLYAGAGAVGMDNSGLWLRMNATATWATTSAITFRNASVFSTIDAVLSTLTVTGSRYLNLLIDPNSTPVGLEVIKSSTAQRVNITHDLTVQRDANIIGALTVNGTAVTLAGQALPLSGGTLTGTLTSRAITPNADNTHDLGASGARWQDIYAVNLHVGTIVGTPSYSHSHAASDITSGTLDFARIPTTWTGALTLDADSAGTSNYVRWLTQTSTGKAWDLIGRAHDFATAAQQNDMLLTYYDGTTTHIVFQADNTTRIVDFGQTPTVGGTAVSLSGHTHDDRYFTEAESDARYVQTATLSNYLLASGATTGATSQAQTFTNGVRTGNGTALVPAFSFSASDSTGIYRQAVDSLSIATVGTERLRVNASGQISINGAPITGYVVTAQPATGQTGGMTLEGTYASAGFLFNTSAILRHAAGATMQAMRWVPTEEPQGAITTFININNNLRLDNSAFNVTNVRLAQGQLLSQAGYTGAITSLSMFHALNASLGGATLTNQYGYYCAALSGATNSYAFYSAGSTPSYFGGTVQIIGDAEVTGDVLVGAGSASLPSIAALSDTNTGLYWSAADTLAVTTGGAQRATFSSGGVTVASALTVPTINTASGNLTIAPAGGTTAVTGALSLTGTLSSTSWNITSAGAATAVTVAASTKVTTPLIDTASGNLSIAPGGTTIATFTTTALGVGTITPEGLQVQGALTEVSRGVANVRLGIAGGTPRINLDDGTNQWQIDNSAGLLRFFRPANVLIDVDGSGHTRLYGGNIGSNNYASQLTGWRVTGAGAADFRYIYTDEMHAKAFIADLEQALAGGQIIAKSVTLLASDFRTPYFGGQQRITVRDLPSAPGMQVFVSGDHIALRSFARASGELLIGYAWGTVTSPTDNADGTQTWTFNRSGTSTYNAITQRGTATSATTAAGASVAPSRPTGVVSGDVLVAVVTHDGSADTITATGWTLLGSATGTDINGAIYYKVAGGSEGASYTFSTANSHALAAAVVAYYNVDTAYTPIDGYSIQANAAGANMSASTVWASSTVGELVFLGGVSNNTSSTPPAGMAELIDAGATGIRVYVADQTLAAAGAVGTKTATISSSSFASIGALIMLRPTISVFYDAQGGGIVPGSIIAKDAIIVDYGTSGNGYYEVNAADGLNAENSPYSQIVTWTTHPGPAGNRKVRSRWGNLNGLSIADYGLVMGTDANSPTTTTFDFRASTGNLTLGANGGAIILEGGGNSYFSGAMTIGTSGGIYQGTGTFATPTTGLKIWNSGGIGRIGGYNTGTLQWYANTDGKLYAGAGNAVLDSGGISVVGDGVFRIMQDASTLKGYIYSSNPLDSSILNSTGVGIKTNGTAATEGISLRANSASGRTTELAISSSTSGRIVGYVANGTTTGQMELSATSFALALNGTGTADFSVDGSGNVAVAGSLSAGNGYTLSAGGIAAGDIGVNYSPTSGNWGTSGSTLLLNGLDHTTIGFHDSNNRVDFIRVGAGLITLGYNGGFGAANVAIGGTVRTAAGVQWDLGGYTGGAPTATGYVTVVINGVTYKLLAST